MISREQKSTISIRRRKYYQYVSPNKGQHLSILSFAFLRICFEAHYRLTNAMVNKLTGISMTSRVSGRFLFLFQM